MRDYFAIFFIFFLLKITGTVNWSWWWVTSPLWITYTIWFLIGFFKGLK